MPKERHFEVRLGGSDLSRARLIIDDRFLAIAARIEDPVVNFEDDDRVTYSSSRRLSDPLSDMVFQVPESQFGVKVKKGMKIQARLVMVPPGVKLGTFRTLKEALCGGCGSLEPLWASVK